jgi:NTE family protein
MTNVILVLQGGGALGAFQCGAYKALSGYFRKNRCRLIAVVGSSIGAVNAAFIARHGSQIDGGAGALESFWRNTLAAPSFPFFPLASAPYWRSWNGLLTGMLVGNAAIFRPNFWNWNPIAGNQRFKKPLYDTIRAEQTFAKHIGTFPANTGSWPLLAVRAMDVARGSPVLFHSWNENVTATHVRASLSVPLLFPPVEIDGVHYWDGDFWPMTALPQVLGVLRGQKLDSVLVVTIENYSRAGDLPESALELTYRLFVTTMGERAEHEERWMESTNRYMDFVDDLNGLAQDLPSGPLRDRIERERAHVAGEGLLRLSSIRISRTNLPDDHVSRDFDYSPERIDLLIGQGESAAHSALRDLKTPPSTQRQTA